jgi:hypothetical protein
MRLASRVFRLILLLSVVLNLGDAPYLDEIFDAGSPLQQQTADASIGGSGGASNSPQAPDPTKHACSGYELLLHLYGVVHEVITLATASGTSERPAQEFLFVALVPRERIDRPPESGFLVI